jgi:hypothetical protein
MKSERLLLRTQESATASYPVLDESNPHTPYFVLQIIMKLVMYDLRQNKIYISALCTF